MKIEDKSIFLHIDGVKELMEEYCEFLQETKGSSGHTIVVYGDTGCGKKFFSEECIKKIKNKNEDIFIIDLLDNFKASNYSSEEKLKEILGIIEYKLKFEKLDNVSANPEKFKIILEDMLNNNNKLLLIRFPHIEVFEEIQKYYAYLSNKNTILYFITEKKEIVDECMKKIEDIRYFQCEHLKEGDGKLVIEKLFSDEEYPKFNVDEIEQVMSAKPLDKKMTIKELKKLCEYTYSYAKQKGIENITYETITMALAAHDII